MVLTRSSSELAKTQDQISAANTLRERLTEQGLGEFAEQILAMGIECEEDLSLLKEEDLRETGMSRVRARKTLLLWTKTIAMGGDRQMDSVPTSSFQPRWPEKMNRFVSAAKQHPRTFLMEFEKAARSHGISEDFWTPKLIALIEGTRSEWAIKQLTGLTYQRAKERFLAEVVDDAMEAEAEDELKDLKSANFAKIDDFVSEYFRLARIADIDMTSKKTLARFTRALSGNDGARFAGNNYETLQEALEALPKLVESDKDRGIWISQYRTQESRNRGQKRRDGEDTQPGDNNKKRKTIVCHYCEKKGHYANKCRKKIRDEKHGKTPKGEQKETKWKRTKEALHFLNSMMGDEETMSMAAEEVERRSQGN